MMNAAIIYEQMRCIAERLTAIQASDAEGVETVFRDLLQCETDTMKLYDEIKGEILKIHSEEVTDEEFRQKIDGIRNKIIVK